MPVDYTLFAWAMLSVYLAGYGVVIWAASGKRDDLGPIRDTLLGDIALAALTLAWPVIALIAIRNNFGDPR